ncbi:MAG: hypothetical protein M3320_02350 [Actinomycetota bacterium]|nr:hypothetical protein [Actinomycetota bacterium]MDQ5807493.1 hypothetical protein [Actinomycetota bacterium]
MPPLTDVLEIFAAGGGVIGALAGFAVPPASDRALIENVVDGAALGAVVGAAFGFTFWIAGKAAGG